PASASQDMQREGKIVFLGCCPEGIVLRRAVRLILRRGTPDQSAAQAFLSHTFEFRHTGRNILKRNRTQADQSRRVVAAILRSPIVERPETLSAQLGVIETKQQHAHRSIEGFGADTVTVLLFQAFGRVPHAFGRYVESFFDVLGQFFRALTRAEEASYLDGL